MPGRSQIVKVQAMRSDAIVLYLLLWASFGAMHSALAAPAGRHLLARLAGAADRLAYNAIALVHLLVVLGLGKVLFAGTMFAVPAWAQTIGVVTALVGAGVLIVAGRNYDFARFGGWAQLRAGTPDSSRPAEPLSTSGLNARVRHPLYLGVLLVLWGTATSPFRLTTAIAATAYIMIGIHFEERNLVRLYGDAYRAYRSRVPMIFPHLWKR